MQMVSILDDAPVWASIRRWRGERKTRKEIIELLESAHNVTISRSGLDYWLRTRSQGHRPKFRNQVPPPPEAEQPAPASALSASSRPGLAPQPINHLLSQVEDAADTGNENLFDPPAPRNK